MDCGTCDSASPVLLNKPEEVDVSLTMTDKAVDMLTNAFGDDRSHALLVGVLSGGCSGYMYDLQIVENTETVCQELTIEGFRVLVPSASSHLLDGIEIDSKSTTQTPPPPVAVANPFRDGSTCSPWLTMPLSFG